MSAALLVLNAGSSSLKFSLYEYDHPDTPAALLCRGQIAAAAVSGLSGSATAIHASS